MHNTPLVSIGLVVYNGERSLEDALDSCLNQTFKDFECIIFDNGSNDRTEQICRRYAAQDVRIRYYRNPRNMDAGLNVRQAFQRATGKYFKQATPDEMIQPDFLRLCVDALEADDSLVVAHSLTRVIDEDGQFVEDEADHLRTSSLDPVVRARDLLLKDHKGYPISGLIRCDALQKLPPQGSHPHSARVLLLQLGLLGRFYEVPEYLSINTRRGGHLRTLPGSEKTRQIGLPEWSAVKEFSLSVAHSSLSLAQRLTCYSLIARWVMKYHRRMAQDLLTAAGQLQSNLHSRDAHETTESMKGTTSDPPANVVSLDLNIRGGSI